MPPDPPPLHGKPAALPTDTRPEVQRRLSRADLDDLGEAARCWEDYSAARHRIMERREQYLRETRPYLDDARKAWAGLVAALPTAEAAVAESDINSDGAVSAIDFEKGSR